MLRGIAILALISTSVLARDDAGKWANNPLHSWFDKLSAGKGPCCSVTDGIAIQDPDWRSHEGHYQVHIYGEWVDVPDDAVITEPNLDGRTWVWPIRGYLGTTIRCFLKGAES